MKFALYTLAVLAISSSAFASSTGVQNLRGRHLDTSITEDHKKNKKTSPPTNSTSALETRTEDVATVEVPAAETAPTDAAPAADPPSKSHSDSASSSGPKSPAGETRTEEVAAADPSSSVSSSGPKRKEEVPPAVLETPAAETDPAVEVPAEVAPAEPEAPAEVTPVVVEAPAVEAAPETDPAVEVPAEVAPAEPEAPAEVTPVVVEAPAVEAAPSAEIKTRTCVGTMENYVGYPSTGSIHCTTDCDCISECCGLMTNSAQICTVPTLWDPRFRPTCLGR